MYILNFIIENYKYTTYVSSNYREMDKIRAKDKFYILCSYEQRHFCFVFNQEIYIYKCIYTNTCFLISVRLKSWIYPTTAPLIDLIITKYLITSIMKMYIIDHSYTVYQSIVFVNQARNFVKPTLYNIFSYILLNIFNWRY